MDESNQMQLSEHGIMTHVPGLTGKHSETLAERAAAVDAIVAEATEEQRQIRESPKLTSEGRAEELQRSREKFQARLDEEIQATERLEAGVRVFVDTLGARPSIPAGVDREVWTSQVAEITAHLRAMPSDLDRRVWAMEHLTDSQVLYAISRAPASLPLLPPEEVNDLLMASAEQRHPEVHAAYEAERTVASLVRGNVQTAMKLVGVAETPEPVTV